MPPPSMVRKPPTSTVPLAMRRNELNPPPNGPVMVTGIVNVMPPSRVTATCSIPDATTRR